MKQPRLSAERARELFAYDPQSGALTWKLSPCDKIRIGRQAGCVVNGGYRVVAADKVLYPLHRVVWLIETGEWPKQQIDHIDGNPSNNRIDNLRDVSPTVNQQNKRKAQVRSATGILGVFPKRGKFISRIRVLGVSKHLGTFGTFDTPEEAHQAYLTAKRELHAGCTI